MRVSLEKIISEIRSRSIQQRRVFTVILVLSLFISTGVVWKLRSVGITMANDVSCGIEEHEHSDECYSTDYICGYGNPDTDSPEHVHTEECLDGELICTQSVHIHSIRCCDNSLVAEKDEESDELPVVEIPVPEIKDTVSEGDTDETDVDDEVEFVSDDGSYLSDEDDIDYDEIAQRVLNGTHLSPIVEMDDVSDQDKGDIFLKNSDGSHVLIGSNKNGKNSRIYTTFVGGTFQYCIHGVNNDNNFYGRSINGNYGFYDRNSNDVILSGHSQKNGDETIGTFTALKKGSLDVNFYYNNNSTVKAMTEVKGYEDLHKIFVVNPDGSEVEVQNNQINISKGDSLVLCIYSDYAHTFNCSKNHVHNSGCKLNCSENHEHNSGCELNTFYSKDISSVQNSDNNRWFNNNYNDSEYTNKMVRRHQRTYKFDNYGVYTIKYAGLPDCTVNVGQNPGFDVNKLYKIYWVKADGTEVLDEIPEIFVDDSLNFRIYTDYANTINPDNNRPHTIYINEMGFNGISSDNTGRSTTFQDTRDPNHPEREIRVYDITYKFKKPGDFDVLYSAVTEHKVHVYPRQTQDGKPVVLLKTGSTYIDLTGHYTYNESQKSRYQDGNDRYNMEYGDQAELIGYSFGNVNNVANYKNPEFFNSYVLGPSGNYDVQQTNIIYTRAENSFNSTRALRTTVTAMEYGQSTFHFGDDKINFYVNVDERIINEIYVGTKLGERIKDKVHERGTTYEPNAKTKDNLYILYMDGDSYRQQVPIYIYTETSNNMLTFRSADLEGSENNLTENFGQSNVVSFSSPPSVSTVEFNGHQYTKVGVFVIANSPGKTAVYFDTVGNGNQSDYVYFYVEVRSSSSGAVDWQDHADIEITDGGYFEVNREIYSADGKQKVIYYERYSTQVSKVKYSRIFGADTANPLHEFTSADYTMSGEPGEQQFEMNSKEKNNGLNHYDQYKVRSAEFNVSVILVPATARKTIMSVDENGTETLVETKDYLSDINKITVDDMIFKFDTQGIIDALNKCSDHSGMDFSISECLNEVLTEVSFVAEKVFKDENGNVLSYNGGTLGDLTDSEKKFEFELYRNKQGDSKIELSPNNADGEITFENFFLKKTDLNEKYSKPGSATQLPCKEYVFTLKEVIPGNAVNNYISYSGKNLGIKLDDNVTTIYVRVCEEDGKLKTGYYKDPNHAESTGNGAIFTNTVYEEQYVKYTVKKEWSGDTGNPAHNPVSFEIIRKDKNNNESVVSRNGQVRFKLGQDNSWTINNLELPVKYGGKRYSYSVREIFVPNGYSAEYSFDANTNTYTITNVNINSSGIYIKKEWQNHDGTPDNSPAYDSVNVKLQRKMMTVPVPVSVSLHSDYCYDGVYAEKQPIYYNQEFQSFIGEKFSFNLHVVAPQGVYGTVSCVTEFCSCSIRNNGNNNYSVEVSNITDAAYIDITFTPDINSRKKVFDFNNNYGGWTPRGGTVLETNQWGNLDIKKRQAAFHGAMYTLNEPFKYAREIHFNIKSTHYADPNAPVGLKFTMVYSVDGGTLHYNTIEQAMVNQGADWDVNTYYQMPDKFDDGIYFCYECLEKGTGQLQIRSAEIEAVNFPISYEFGEKTVTNSGNIISSWTDDTNFNNNNTGKIYTISKAENWIKNVPSSELNMTPGYVYQYSIIEDHARFHGYDNPIYDVTSYTRNNPMKVINRKAIPYTLPATGGPGTFKIRAVGGILAFGAAAGFVVRRRKKRKSA